MEFETKAKLLTAESKPYNFEGNEGTSHKIRLNIEGEIYVCKSDADQVAKYVPFQGKDGTAVVRLKSRKENMSLELVSFE